MLTPVRLIALLALLAVGAFSYPYFRNPWVEVSERNFQRRVLEARLPALVYFDTAIGCRGGDRVFRTLRRQHRGTLEVFYVNSIAHPGLARAYGVDRDVVFVLFEGGRVAKRATAPVILAAAAAHNQGVYTDEWFLKEMELFANVR